MSRPTHVLNNPPMRLRRVLAEAGIPHSRVQHWCRDVRHRATGQAISLTSLSVALRHSYWPSGYDTPALCAAIEAGLKQEGMSTDGIWEADVGASASHRYRPAPSANVQPDPAPETTTPIPEKEMLTQEAREHFQIAANPFSEDVRSDRDTWLGKSVRYIKQAMYYAARNGGFLAVVGESGAGKTVLRKDLIERLKREERTVVIQAKNPDKKTLTTQHLLTAILADISSERPRLSIEALARQVERKLIESADAGFGHVLIIEEAHNLTTHTLKHLKTIWEIEDGYRKLLSIVLIGQLELLLLLNEQRNPSAREVIRRCEVARLRPLGEELPDYLKHKFARVDIKVGDVFDADAITEIRNRLTFVRNGAREDHTYPLNVHNICIRAMNEAVHLGLQRVTAELVREV